MQQLMFRSIKRKGLLLGDIKLFISLGWNPDSDKEIFDENELINSFQFKQVQRNQLFLMKRNYYGSHNSIYQK